MHMACSAVTHAHAEKTPVISRIFPPFSDISRLFRNISEDFQRFSKIAEDVRKTEEDFR